MLAQADRENEHSASSLRRWPALAALGALAVTLAATGLLWMRFGSQVFLDAALTAWRSCF